MDSITTLLILILLAANLVGLAVLIKRKQPEQNNNDHVFKDEVNSLKKYKVAVESQMFPTNKELVNINPKELEKFKELQDGVRRGRETSGSSSTRNRPRVGGE